MGLLEGQKSFNTGLAVLTHSGLYHFKTKKKLCAFLYFALFDLLVYIVARSQERSRLLLPRFSLATTHSRFRFGVFKVTIKCRHVAKVIITYVTAVYTGSLY